MASSGKKTSEQMNAERRAAKARQKHGGKKEKRSEGFSLTDFRKYKARKERFDHDVDVMVEQAKKRPIVIAQHQDYFGYRLSLMKAAIVRDRLLHMDLVHDKSGEVTQAIIGVKK